EILLILDSEIARAVLDELVDFFEGIFVEEQRDALARRQLAFGPLPRQTLRAAADFSGAVEFEQPFDRVGRFPYVTHLMTGTFSQSFKNISTPRSVNGCFRS